MKKNSICCDFVSPKKPVPKNNKTRFYRYKGNYSWEGLKTEQYKTKGKDWADIFRNTLIGNHGELTKFHLRYFEIAPKGFSSFETHKHEHVVIGIRGEGICIVGKKKYKISINKDVLNKIKVSSENDKNAIDMYIVKRGNLIPRLAYPSIDNDWASWE